jgi:primosomal protein N' (replication factor Y)
MSSDWPLEQLKPAGEILRDMPPLPPDFFGLVRVCQHLLSGGARRSGDAGLPVGLKRLDPPTGARRAAQVGRDAAPN